MKQSNINFELPKDKHGFLIESILKPDLKLFRYTSNTPEATDARKNLFGAERMLAALNQCTEGTPEQVLKAVRSAVDGFVNQAEQFDDLTMLCMKYKG